MSLLLILEYRVRCKSYFLLKTVTPLALTKTKSLSHQLLSLISQLLHMQSPDSTIYAFSHALVVLCMYKYYVRCKSYFLPKAVMPLARTKNKIPQPMLPLPLLIVVPRVRFRFNYLCILPCLSGVLYKAQQLAK